MRKIYLLATIITVVTLLAIGSQAFAQAKSQSVTSHGLTVYFGVVPAEIARGVAEKHGQRDIHTATPATPTQDHLIVAIFNAVTGDRITDAAVTASKTRPGSQTPSEPLEPMKIADTVTYGNFLTFRRTGSIASTSVSRQMAACGRYRSASIMTVPEFGTESGTLACRRCRRIAKIQAG